MRYHLNVLVLLTFLFFSPACKSRKQQESATTSARDSVTRVQQVAQSADSTKASEPAFQPPPVQGDSVSYMGFKFVWGYPMKGYDYLNRLYIFKNDSLIDSIAYWHIYGEKDSTGNYYLPPPVQLYDLDGDGRKEAIFHNYTGGAHCCEMMAIYEFKKGKLVQTTALMGEALIFYRVEDMDRDGIPEIISQSDALVCYDATCTMCMPKYKTVLHYRNGWLYDVTKRFPSFVRAQLDTFMTRFWEWHREDRQRILESMKKDPFAFDVTKGKATGLYVYNYLLGRPEHGIKLVDQYLPEASEWIRSHRTEIDSLVDHWIEGQKLLPIDFFF